MDGWKGTMNEIGNGTYLDDIVPISLFTLLLSLRIIKCIVIVIVIAESVLKGEFVRRMAR